MNTIILIIFIVIVILVCIAIVTFLLLRRRGRKRQHMDLYGPADREMERPTMAGPIMADPTMVGGKMERRIMAGGKMERRIMAGDRSSVGEQEEAELAARREREKQEAELAARRRESFRKKYKISIAHPGLLSKGYASLFVVQIYLPPLRSQARRTIMKDLPIKKVTEHLRDIELEEGLKVRIKLSSPVLSFSDPVIKQIENGLTNTHFTAIPSDNCRPGIHSVVLSIVDVETQVEYLSTSLNVQVADFVIDHVSRPLLSKAMSAVLGLGSVTMFVLTALEQVDKTFGLTAGTAAAVLTSTILLQWWSIFQRPGVTHTP